MALLKSSNGDRFQRPCWIQRASLARRSAQI